jgi:hypothetical protein
MGHSKIRKQYFFNFLGGHFVTKTSLLFLNQHKILNYFNTLFDLFQEKNFHLSEGPFLKFCDTKPKKDRNVTK